MISSAGVGRVAYIIDNMIKYIGLIKNTRYCIIIIEHTCAPGTEEGIMKKRISVTVENSTGRNIGFHDNYTGKNMNRAQFVNQIRNNNYKNYHIRNINGIATPCSNPDGSVNNNLG